MESLDLLLEEINLGEFVVCDQIKLETIEAIPRRDKDLEQILEDIKNLKNEESNLHEEVKGNYEKLRQMKAKLSQYEEKHNILSQKLIAEREMIDYLCSKFKQDANLTTSRGNFLLDIFGLKVKLKPLQNYMWEVKFLFSEDKYAITFFDTIQQIFDIQSIRPPHPNFDNLRNALINNRDISGFLYFLRLFFMKC